MHTYTLTSIRKRDGSVVPFDVRKIISAVEKALRAAREYRDGAAESVAKAVTQKLRRARTAPVPSVEEVQDLVETELMDQHFPASAKAYILYRDERARVRREHGAVSGRVRELADASARYFEENPLGEFVFVRTYARWIESEGRRETWIETVDRYMSFMKEHLGDRLSGDEYEEVRVAILRHEIMPSMRLLQFAGQPARRCNACAYNCSFIAPTRLSDFAEIMYLSMQGCGVGFSVESQHIEQLPQIRFKTGDRLKEHVVADTKEGWCDALTLGLTTWYEGKDISFDYSGVRPAGARLKTMGGKASGPEPLRALLEFAREKIFRRQGRRLRSIDVHDIICKIGECVVSGGVRRTAMISLSDLDDGDLRDAKKGQFYLTEPQRSVANNSAVYADRPTNTELMEEWVALMKSGSGERGIFNRGALMRTMPERRREYFHAKGFLGSDGIVRGPIGTNPCGEIILQSKQFCNLSEIIARSHDTHETLIRKARLAALLGTYQSTLTTFSYISDEWKTHCEEERLLGVSVTGQWDSSVAREPATMQAMRDTIVTSNKRYAERFGITPSLSVTAVKPSGTVSQAFNCSSGIHPRHAHYYIRRVRISATDALFAMLKDQGVPYHPEVGQSEADAHTFVLEFPVKAPVGSVCKDDLSALEQLEYWKRVKLNFTEHNPSATISVGDDEWISVVHWIQTHWDIIGGLSFLPRFDHVYRLAPYEEITEERYGELARAFPRIDYAKLVQYERSDTTEQKRELACAGGLCDIDAIPSDQPSGSS